MKKYTTDWKTTILIFLIGTSLVVISSYDPEHLSRWLQGAVVFTAIMASLVSLMTIGSYAVINKGTLRFVYLLFYRQKINIRSITEITDQPTYKVASGMFRSVYIFYTRGDGKQKYVELRMGVFPKKEIVGLINELKSVNPDIKLSKFCEHLIQSM